MSESLAAAALATPPAAAAPVATAAPPAAAAAPASAPVARAPLLKLAMHLVLVVALHGTYNLTPRGGWVWDCVDDLDSDCVGDDAGAVGGAGGAAALDDAPEGAPCCKRHVVRPIFCP